ncbi:MAG: hypothetical protein ACPGU9_04325 [Flavobacteriaceae bacterium]
MKSFKFAYLLVLLTSITFLSCENEPLTGTFTDEIGEGDSNSDSGGFYAKVDNAEFIEDSVTSAVETSTTPGTISVLAVRNNTEFINVNFPEDITPGEYDFDSFGDISAQYALNQTTTGYLGEGVLTIVSHDTVTGKVVGTFSFTAIQLFPTPGAPASFEITEGAFDLTYL